MESVLDHVVITANIMLVFYAFIQLPVQEIKEHDTSTCLVLVSTSLLMTSQRGHLCRKGKQDMQQKVISWLSGKQETGKGSVLHFFNTLFIRELTQSHETALNYSER
jgi:hypothetical protein